MPDIANFIAQNRPRFNRADIDRKLDANALLRNEVDRLPQANRMQDLQIQRQEQAVGSAQVENAMGILDRQLAMIEASPRAKETAMQITSSPDWQSLTSFLKLPPTQITAEDTDDALRAQAQQLRQSLRGVSQQQNVARTWVNPQTQTMWALDRSGRSFDTGVPAAQFAQRPVETGAGIEAFDPARGSTGGPISPAATAPALDAAALARKESEALGAGRGQAQAQREASEPQRQERARQQITNIDNTLAQVDRALGSIDWNTVGFIGNLSRAVPGTPAHDMQQTLLTIQANLGFDRIQQMRESSPTGGALGQVAVQELNALQASVAALAQSQSGEQFRDNLLRVKQHYQNWRNVITQAQQPQGMPDFSQMTDEQLLQIINGQ